MTTLPANNGAPKNAVSQRPLPGSLKLALADSFQLDHPDVPWSLPAKLPPTDDIATGISILQGQLAPVDRKHAAYCLMKLAVAFDAKHSADESKLRLEIWLEANGDLPDDLWTAATLQSVQVAKWMPKPAEFRAMADVKFQERTKLLRRARMMLEASTQKPAAAPFVKERRTERVRGMRNSFRRVGDLDKAAHYERLLAKEIGREPHAWAIEQRAAAPLPVPVLREPFEPIDTPGAKARRDWLAEQGKIHRGEIAAPADGELADSCS